MSLIQLPSMISAVPEIFLACAGMILLMIGVFRKTDGTGVLSMATILCFIVAIMPDFCMAAKRMRSTECSSPLVLHNFLSH